MAIGKRVSARAAGLQGAMLAGLGLASTVFAWEPPGATMATPQSLSAALLTPQVTAFIGSPSVAAAWQVSLKAQHLRASPAGLSLRVEQHVVHFEHDAAAASSNGAGSWTARVADDGASFPAILSPQGLTAVFRVEDHLYRLVPLGGGQHLLVRVDETRLPPMHAPGSEPVARQRHPAETLAPASTPSVIRVMVAASAEAAAGYPGDLRALTQLAIAESNRTYDNSGLAIRLELADFRVTDYAETRNMSLDLRRFAAPADGHLDTLHAVRDSTRADVGILLLHRAASCGEAAEIGATATTAFVAVLVDCATGEFTLAHEIGHLGGARHDPKRDPATQPFAFGHGYWYQPPRTSGWRTVMSYDCPTGCRRIPYWSSPQLHYQGVPVGDATQADNRRVLDTTRATLAAFR